VADGKVTPKVQALIKILLKYQHTEDFRAIIFVERVVAALVLPKVVAFFYYSYFLTVGYSQYFCCLYVLLHACRCLQCFHH